MAPTVAGRVSPGALYAGGTAASGAQKAPKSIRGSCGSASDPDAPPKEIRTSEQTEDFMINVYKLKLCPRSSSHDWRTCPYAHQGENAARRDHQRYQYLSVCCPESKAKRLCPRGNDCPFAHSMTEYFLHPARYRTQMCNDGAKCTRPICFFAHSASELRTPAYPSLNPSQLEALFSARASLAREDEAALEQTLRACVIGQLPPLPNTVAPAPGCDTGSPMCGAPGSAHGSGSHAGRPATGSASGPLPDLRCGPAGLGLDCAALGAGQPYGPGGLTYLPYVQAPAPAGDDGMGGAFAGGALYGGCGGAGGAGFWGSGSGAGAAAAAPAASQPFAPQDFVVPIWLQQQQQQPPQQQPAPFAPPQHRQSLANLAEIQRLRDQLRAAEEAELASIAQAEVAFNSQAVAAAVAMQGLSVGGGGASDASSAAALLCGAGARGAGGGAGLDSGFCSTPHLAPDVLASGPHQFAPIAGAAAPFVLADGAADGAGKRAGSDAGSGTAGANSGMHLLSAFWGSGSVQSDPMLLLPGATGAANSAPLATLHHHQQQQPQQVSVWPPPAFGGPQLGPAAQSSLGLRATGSLDGGCGSGWSFSSAPNAGSCGPSLLSGAGSQSGVASLLSSAPGSAGGVSGAGSVYTAPSLSHSGSTASAGGAAFAPPSQSLPGMGTPLVQPSTPQHAPAGSPAGSSEASPARAPVSSQAAAHDADPFVPASSAANAGKSRSAPLSSLSPLLHCTVPASGPSLLGQAGAPAAALVGPQAPVPVASIDAEDGGMRLMLLQDA